MTFKEPLREAKRRMTFEEALREAKLRLKKVKSIKEFFNIPLIKETIIWLEKVIEALEKQIPMKPENGQDANFYWWLVCPKCKNVLLEEFYCPECGQHIDWSDEE